MGFSSDQMADPLYAYIHNPQHFWSTDGSAGPVPELLRFESALLAKGVLPGQFPYARSTQPQWMWSQFLNEYGASGSTIAALNDVYATFRTPRGPFS